MLWNEVQLPIPSSKLIVLKTSELIIGSFGYATKQKYSCSQLSGLSRIKVSIFVFQVLVVWS